MCRGLYSIWRAHSIWVALSVPRTIQRLEDYIASEGLHTALRVIRVWRAHSVWRALSISRAIQRLKSHVRSELLCSASRAIVVCGVTYARDH